MPLYDFRCRSCSDVKEKYANHEHRLSVCDFCGGEMVRLVTTRYSVHRDLKPYLDEHIAENPVWVKSKKHREELMKKHGVYESHGKGWI